VRRLAAPFGLLAALAGCGPRPWYTASIPLHPGAPVPIDSRIIYHAMGFMSDTTGLRCVGSLHFLAGATPDSTLAVFGVSLANRALRFIPQGQGFAASYHIELEFRTPGGMSVRDIVRDETVLVGSSRETLRNDESVLFQETFAVAPGAYTLHATIRDRNSPVDAHFELSDTVPRFAAPSLGDPIAVYEGDGRASLRVDPKFVLNTRYTLHYGPDSLHVYVEGYGLKAGTKLAASVVDLDTMEFWRDTVATNGDSTFARAMIAIPPGTLPLGRATLRVEAVGAPAHTSAPLLVGFSDRWAVQGFDQMVVLLRDFPRHDLWTALRDAPHPARVTAWRTFAHASNPDSAGTRNVALEHYFTRVEEATQRFSEPGVPGWQTDRGEVYIALGDPDRSFDVPGSLPGLRWEYDNPHLTLIFKDDTGLGQFHLTPESRTEFDKATGKTPAETTSTATPAPHG